MLIFSEHTDTTRADCYTVAIGADYLIRVGIGYTYKRITERVTDSYYSYDFVDEANGEDVGITVELPLWRIWRSKHPTNLLDAPPAVQITPRYTYVIANNSADGTFMGSTHKGLSLHASYSPDGLTKASLILVGEIEENRLDTRKVRKKGIEIGCLEITYIRHGNFKDDPMTDYGNDINTLGLGFSFNGLIKWAQI